MKVIFRLQGTVAARVSSDDVVPERGLLQRELVQVVASMYNFAIRPVLPPNMQPQAFPILAFQEGTFTDETGSYPVQSLVIYQNGDAVSAANTEIAEKILNDYMERLDAGFGFRYAGKPQRRYYLSNIVVEFDGGITEYIPTMTQIAQLLAFAMPGREFDLKSFSLGSGDPQSGQISSLDEFENADFKIERRGEEPYARNRYFSSAPLRTADHVQVLEQIERVLRGAD